MLSCCRFGKKQQSEEMDPAKDKDDSSLPIENDADAVTLFNKRMQRRRNEANKRGETANNIGVVDGKSPDPTNATSRETEKRRLDSVLKIQSTIRMFLGKCKRRYAYHNALGDLELWLEEKNKWLAYEGKRRGAIITARKGFILRYTNALFSGAVAFFAETGAILTIQRMWRGHSSRLKFPFTRKLRIKKIKYEPRYGPEVYRRLWAWRHFEPEGGCRVDKRSPYYDMWSHIDNPPKGESYGVRSHKILANDQSLTSLHRLATDENSWVGFQTVLLTDEELTHELNESQRRLLLSPLALRSKKKKIVHVAPEGQKANAYFGKLRREKAQERMQKRAERAVIAASKGNKKGAKQGRNVQMDSSMSLEGASVSKHTLSNDLNFCIDDTIGVNIEHENEKMPEEDWGNDTSRSSYWTRRFKKLFVTPLRGTRKPTPFTHRAAQAAAVASEMLPRKERNKKSIPFSQSVGATSRMLISSIMSPNEEKINNFETIEGLGRISMKNLVSYERARLVLKEMKISEYALAFDHGKAMIEEQKRRAIVRKTGNTTFMELPKDWWHENFNEIGEMIGYIRYDTQERWDLNYDDFGRKYYVNNITKSSSTEAPQNPQNPLQSCDEDDATIPSHQMNQPNEEEGEDGFIPVEANLPVTMALPTSQRTGSTASHKSSLMRGKYKGSKSSKPKQQPFGSKIGEILRQYHEANQPDIDFLRESSHATSYLALNQHGHIDDGSKIFSLSSSENKIQKGKNQVPKKLKSSEFCPGGGTDNSHDKSTSLDPDTFKSADGNILQDANAYKNTPWARLKDATLHLVNRVNKLAQTKNQANFELNVPMKQKKTILSKVKIWKTKPRSNYYFKHTWLPQPMVGESVKSIHHGSGRVVPHTQFHDRGFSSPSICSTTSSPHAMVPGGDSIAFEDSIIEDYGKRSTQRHVRTPSSARHFNYLKSNAYNTIDGTTNLSQLHKPESIKTTSRFQRFMDQYIYKKSVEQRDKGELHSYAFK